MIEQKSPGFARHFRPVHLAAAVFMYLLGSGLAKYLGEGLDPGLMLLGLAWLISTQLGMFFLGDYFQCPFDVGLFQRSADLPKPDQDADPNLWQLFISVALLAAGAVLTVILGVRGALNLTSSLLMMVYFLLQILIVAPGISLEQSGIGEFISSVVLVILPPALAFLLQVGDFHRLVILSVFPLFPLNLALILSLRLKTYPDDLANHRKNLLVRLGWIQGVFLHNLLVFSGFLLFGLSLLFGMPFKLIGPIFLTLPAGLTLIWYLTSLQTGAPVRWSMIRILSLTVFFLPTYLLTFSIWTR